MSSAALSAQDSLIDQLVVDKYRIIRVIGKGGMGVVYEGEHVELGKRVAIKMMLEKYADDGEATTRFKREALAASRIGNPHIIDIIDIGMMPDGRPFCVMEYLEGLSLGDLIKRTPPGQMPVWRAIAIMRETLRAVGAAHAKGIIHRDLKPDNIFLVNQDDHHDFVKLLDFGISKIVDQAAEIAATRLTTTGMVMGTPLYMAPEQAMGNPTDQFADMYALGVIMYEMLTGKPPFDGVNYPILVAKLLTSDPPLLSEMRHGLPPSLVAAVHRALEKEPQNRFTSCDAFAAALPVVDRTSSSLELAQTLDSGSVTAVPKPSLKSTAAETPAKRSKLPLIIGGIGAGLAVGAIALVALTRDPNKPSGPIVETIETPDKGSAAAAPPPQPDLPKGTPVGMLHVKSIPPGAMVTIDKVPSGSTPLSITVAAGKHMVRVELDGNGIDEAVEVKENAENSVSLLVPTTIGGGSGSGSGAGSAKKPGGIGKTVPKGPLIIKPQDKPHVEPPLPGGPPQPDPVPEVKKADPPKTDPKTDPKPQNPYDTNTPTRRPNPYH